MMRQRMMILEGIAKGEAAIQEERVMDNDAAKQRLAKWLK